MPINGANIVLGWEWLLDGTYAQWLKKFGYKNLEKKNKKIKPYGEKRLESKPITPKEAKDHKI